MMSAHDFAIRTDNQLNCLQEIIKWSRKDEESYTGDVAITDKWRALSSKTSNVSYHTLFALAHANTLNWPKVRPAPKMKSKRATSPKPVNTEFVNFTALLDFYNMVVYRDANTSGKLYLSGDEDVMHKYFEDARTSYYYEKYRGIFSERSLIPAFHIMCQDVGFTGISHTQIQQHLKNVIYQTSRSLDLVKKYFDMPFEDLPTSYQENKQFMDSSTVETLFNCLDIAYLTNDHLKENKLYFKYYKSWLMGLVRNLYLPDDIHMNNCVLLLTGREQTRKTSHFRYLLPSFMREDRIAITTHGFKTEGSMRDLTKLAAGNTVLIWDEIEQYLDESSESNFKKLIDGNPTKFIDKYETVESFFKPISIYGATSNKMELKLSDTGSRRIFNIPIKWVDTDKMARVCWWRVINDLKDEVDHHKGIDPPWLLTRAELDYQATLHKRITAKSGLEIIICEVFDFGSESILPNGNAWPNNINPLKHPNFLSTKKVTELLFLHSDGNVKVNRAHLVRLLHNLCGTWTGTVAKTKAYTKPKMVIDRGMATYSGRHERWVMPIAKRPYDE